MKKQHCCPWWVGYFLINPLRKLSENPNRILKNFVTPGMHVLEFGPGMGYFTPAIADLCGLEGRVVAVDIQKKMLDTLHKRMQKRGLDDRLETVLVEQEGNWTIGLENSMDFLFAAAVVHEVPDQARLFADFYTVLKPGAELLFVEPKGHVKEKAFRKSLQFARQAGFAIAPELSGRKRAALLTKKM